MFIIDGLGTGGKERQIVELLKGLSKCKQYAIAIISTERDSFYLPDVIDLEIPVYFITRQMKWDPFVFIKILRKVKKYKPHIIHTCGLVPTFYAIPVAKYLKVPIVNGSIRNAFSSGNYKLRIEKLLLNMSDYIIANSKTGLTCRGLKESHNHVVIYNGFDFKRIQKTSIVSPKVHSLPKGKKLIGMVAEFSDYKDQPTFIRAAIKILQKRNDTLFVLVGDGKNVDMCKKMAEPFSSGIVFLGLCKRVESIIHLFTIGVLTSFTEGISNSIMEYMAAGKPVIATNGGATHEIVIDGTTGFLIPVRDSDRLAEKIDYLINNNHLSVNMGAMGRQRLEQNFSLENLTNNTVSLYQKILGNSLCR
jgi:glycosyltransferase involved in cell wall biosynthesis